MLGTPSRAKPETAFLSTPRPAPTFASLISASLYLPRLNIHGSKTVRYSDMWVSQDIMGGIPTG